MGRLFLKHFGARGCHIASVDSAEAFVPSRDADGKLTAFAFDLRAEDAVAVPAGIPKTGALT